uniref:Distal membrane-arm assembly complex protein 1-like domain-containing protein n=1 Tax=Pavo cristatus TaxID=9049 RepID=A0A8C9FXE1_PAVCR
IPRAEGGSEAPVPLTGPPRADPGAAGGAAARSLLARCWSCRFLGGTALLAAAAWIYRRPRALIRSGIAPSMGDVAQITFAICERGEKWGGGEQDGGRRGWEV